jgi:iron complex transport system ATP-binding protein
MVTGMLEAKNLTVRLEGRAIIADMDFSALAGEVTAIVGPNGSGKSTLLKALCNDVPASGTVRLNGRDLRSMKPYEAATLRAVLPQASVLTFPFTVHEVVRMGLTAGVSGAGRAADRHLPDEALRRVDLGGFGGRLYQTLSGGEQQRAQLARVLCQVWQPVLDGAPRFLLLDEPIASLDIKHQLLVMEIARDFAQAGGGVVAILHDLNLAALHADRLLAIKDGRAVAFGRPADILDAGLIADVFDCDLTAIAHPGGGRVFAPPLPTMTRRSA